MFRISALPLLLCCASTTVQAEQSATVAAHAAKAQRAERVGDFVTAIREYTALSRLLPDSAEIYANLGVAYYFYKQPAEALAACGKALGLKPDLLSALVFSGLALYDLSQPAEAVRTLEQALRINPSDPLALKWLGFSYVAVARYDLAADRFHAASKLNPDDIDVWYGLGQSYLELGLRETRHLAETAPDGARIWQMAADQFHLRGDEGQARLLYGEAATRPTRAGSPEDGYYFSARDYEERARDAFGRITSLEPDSYRAHQVIAETLAAQGRTEEAIAEYRAVLQRKPGMPAIHMAIGDLWMQTGQPAKALGEYREELPLRRNAGSVQFRLGRAWLALGDEVRAEAALRKALALKVGIAEVQRELAKIEMQRRNYAAAARSFAEYLKVKETDASAHYQLMQAYLKLGDGAAAEDQRRLFQKYSIDKRQRNQAQQALSLFERGREVLP